MLENLEPPKKQLPCKVRTYFNELDAKDSAILKNAIDDEVTWQANTLAIALGNRGIKLGQESIRRHRRGSCSC